MEEEKNKKEDCPLCRVSQETLGRLKEKNKEKKPEEKLIKKKKGLLGKLLRK